MKMSEPNTALVRAAQDTKPTERPAPSGFSAVGMIRTLGIVAMVSGFLVVLVHQLTASAIEANRQAMIEAAVLKVLPGSVSQRAFTVGTDGLEEGTGSGRTVYAGYDVAGNLVGVAAEGAAQGYADVIRLLYGYDPRCQCIVGMSVVKMAETPGLGDKIATDPAFQANFRALWAHLDAVGRTLAKPIRTVKHGSKQNPWEIDAITGATISSKAVGRAINDSAQDMVPRIAAGMEALSRPMALQEANLHD